VALLTHFYERSDKHPSADEQNDDANGNVYLNESKHANQQYNAAKDTIAGCAPEIILGSAQIPL
jgi:hypothetical protein